MDTVNVKKYPGHVTADVEVKKESAACPVLGLVPAGAWVSRPPVFGLVALPARLRRGHIPRGVPKLVARRGIVPRGVPQPVTALLRSRKG